jgi:hypothetical protein
MRALQVLRVLRAARLPVRTTVRPVLGAPDIPGRRAGAVRPAAVLLSLICGLAWWWSVLGLAIRPEAAGPWQSAMAAGGWSLGLIPLHAVPMATKRRKADAGDPGAARPFAPEPPPECIRVGPLSPDAGFHGCTLPGHDHTVAGPEDPVGDEGRGL